MRQPYTIVTLAAAAGVPVETLRYDPPLPSAC
jgi:hypothetical protein